MEPAPKWPKAALISGGAAVTALGVVLQLLALDARSDVDRASQVERQGLVGRANRLTVASGVSTGIGLSAITGGLLWLLYED